MTTTVSNADVISYLLKQKAATLAQLAHVSNLDARQAIFHAAEELQRDITRLGRQQ